MKLFSLFLLVFLPYLGETQQISMLYSNANNDLRLTIVDHKRFDLDYKYNLFEAGRVDWEQGRVKARKNRLVLISDDSDNSTHLKKMVLKRSSVRRNDSAYFLADEEELWKVCRVKNKPFYSRMFTTENTQLLNNQEFPK